MIRIRELLKEIGGLSLHGHRNEGKWHGEEAELQAYEEFEELESLIEKNFKLSELYKELATLYRDRFDYTDSASEIQRLWVKIKELEK